MKNLVLGAILLISSVAYGQKEGRVAYTDTRKFEIDLGDSNLPEEMLAQLPKESSSDQELIFNETASLYRNAPKEESAAPLRHSSVGSSGEMEFEIRFDSPENFLYQDLKKAETTQQLEWMGERFLITGPATRDWKISTEQRAIMGYPCMKATTMRDSTEIVAWFTPQIPVSLGPDTYGGLPGLILEVVENDGSRVIKATEISLEAIDEKIKRPHRGKKMTREAFKKFQEEKMAEMEAMQGEGGNTVFIIQDEG